MNQEQRQVLEFWARLASAPTPDRWSEWQQLQLLEDMQKSLLPWLNDSTQGATNQGAPSPEFQDKVRAAWTGEVKEKQLSSLLRLLSWRADKYINGLWRDGKVRVSVGHTLVWTWEHGQFHERREEPQKTPADFLFIFDARLGGDLTQSIRDHHFPFRMCLVCLRVFVPVKRQKYCSPNCSYRGIEAARKEEKREYMQAYMAKRRKRLKQKARQGRKEK